MIRRNSRSSEICWKVERGIEKTEVWRWKGCGENCWKMGDGCGEIGGDFFPQRLEEFSTGKCGEQGKFNFVQLCYFQYPELCPEIQAFLG